MLLDSDSEICDLARFPVEFEAIFIRPIKLLRWREIVPRAVAQNTFRGFHKLSKERPGAKAAFVGYFEEQASALQDSLAEVHTREQLHALYNQIDKEIRERLSNCKATQLAPYNKVRKLIDLYVEHLVAMALELNEIRPRLVPFLFLPLDSWIIENPGLFSDSELSSHGLSRTSTYSAITSEQSYLALQELVRQKANKVASEHGRPFHPIYFDLLWQNRYQRGGDNLFATNP
jgi:hypothetical protein